MTKKEKIDIVNSLFEELSSASCFFIANSEGMNGALVNDFRRICFDKSIKYKIVKNTLIKKALERIKSYKKDLSQFESQNYDDFINSDVFSGNSGLLIIKEVSGTPAKVIKNFKVAKDVDLPLFKGAYVDGDFYIGEHNLEFLSNLKTREELIGEVINILQSPIKNVLSGLNSGKQILTGLLKALSDKSSN